MNRHAPAYCVKEVSDFLLVFNSNLNALSIFTEILYGWPQGESRVNRSELMKKTDIRHGRHCVFNMHVHLVFVTKYRRRVFTKSILESMKSILLEICADFRAELTQFDGETDHVHLLVNYPPQMSVGKLVNSMKGVTSRMLRQWHPELREKYFQGVLWSPSYFAASCGGAPISIIKQYIEQQKTPD